MATELKALKGAMNTRDSYLYLSFFARNREHLFENGYELYPDVVKFYLYSVHEAFNSARPKTSVLKKSFKVPHAKTYSTFSAKLS